MVKVIVEKMDKLRYVVGEKLNKKTSKIMAIIAFIVLLCLRIISFLDIIDEQNESILLLLCISLSMIVFITIIIYIKKYEENIEEYKLLKELEEQVATSGIDKI